MWVACGQIGTKIGAKQENIEKICAYMSACKETYPETKLMVFPELALTGYECNKEEAMDMAEAYHGPSAQTLGKHAKELGLHLIYGFAEQGPSPNTVYNSAVLIDDQGKPLGAYRKMHLVAEEQEIFSCGSDYPVFDTKIGKIGIMICWDTAFPETARILTLRGADLIAVPAAWEAPNQYDWDLAGQARAFDNVIPLVTCNQVGKERTLEFFGRSKVIAPLGKSLTDIVEGKECILAADVDLQEGKRLQNGYYSLLRDRRPETYQQLLKD